MKLRRLFAVLLFVVVLISSCHYNVNQFSPEKEDYKIYLEFIKYWRSENGGSSNGKIVINMKTGLLGLGSLNDVTDILDGLATRMPILNETIIQDFRMKNLNSIRIDRQPFLLEDIIFVSMEDIEKTYLMDNSWDSFYKDYPGSSGILSLSMVGYNHTKDQALLYTSNYCGVLCGSGRFIVFECNNGRWKVKESILVWMS